MKMNKQQILRDVVKVTLRNEKDDEAKEYLEVEVYCTDMHRTQIFYLYEDYMYALPSYYNKKVATWKFFKSLAKV